MAAVDTFELLPSLASGELAETSAPELVAAVFRSRASGTLLLETREGAEMRMFFRAGDMCGAATFEGFQTLAHVLLANDWVNALDIETSGQEAMRANKRHGEVLVEKGLLSADQLRSALVAQHTTNLLTLLRTTEGKYEWRGWEPPPSWSREVGVDPVGCLVDALEQDTHAARRRKVLDWLGEHPARLSVDWPELQGRIALPPLDMRAASLLALPRRRKQFAKSSTLLPPRAEALLAVLLLVGAAEPQPLKAPERQPEPQAEDEGEILEPEPLIEPIPEEEEEALELDTAAPPAASPAAAPPAARVSEDEAIARLDSLELDERPKPGAADLRKKLLSRGLRNLGAIPPPQRADVEGGIELETPAPMPQTDASLSYEDQKFADEVRSRARLMARQNAYEQLGVQPGMATEPIKTAYIQLAKRFHPDRAAGPLSGLQRELESLFASLKEAYEKISTTQARAAYDAQIKAGGSRSGSRKEEAAVLLKMGEVLLKKRDFEAALGKLRRAVDLDANGDTLAALAWALISDPKAPAQAKEEAVTVINRALRATGPTARTYYVAGVIWRTKDPDSSADAFRKALELDPNHPDAALELRLIEQRRGKTGNKAAGGVLSGLFGKRKG